MSAIKRFNSPLFAPPNDEEDGVIIHDGTVDALSQDELVSVHGDGKVKASGYILLHATAVLDFPSITNHTSEELTMTVTGARAGDGVVAIPPATLEDDLAFNAFVTSNDTVTIRVSNVNSSPINPASAVWGAIVIHRVPTST